MTKTIVIMKTYNSDASEIAWGDMMAVFSTKAHHYRRRYSGSPVKGYCRTAVALDKGERDRNSGRA